MKRITMTDVAKRAGVSKSTVSQYLNGRFEYMSKETRTKLEQAIKDLNYQPNMVARSLKQKSSTTIGVIVANILHVYSTQVIRAIEDLCHEKGFHLIVCNADDQPEKEKKYIEMLKAKQVDGIIAFPTGGNIALYQQLTEEGYPLVFMDRIVEGLEVDTILLDNKKAAALAADKLMHKGYRHLTMAGPPLTHQVTPRVERAQEFIKKVQEENNHTLKLSTISGEISEMEGHLREIFQQKDRPDAIFAMNDLTLHEVLSFLKKEKLQIPSDVAVISIDEVSFAAFYTPPLTTISQPAFEMGRKAAEILFSFILEPEKQHHSKIIRFEPVLNRRESC
ncbi:LacI family DNA-binding transcriptional regulator [Oceanobacillus sojae]|uniref:LacI family DNA-binding transcriptional regulator n=1 Tax=Oceanobacillus sojae TaxID=582851 RepID=UPI0009888462|nr:substrate-binding domain-containing protein [Oceanobacillus sojae]